MPRTHGELFGEIGKLVFDAHHGEPIDLASASSELADRYADLRLPADSIARAIARSASAVGVSLTLVAANSPGQADDTGDASGPEPLGPASVAPAGDDEPLPRRKPAFAGLASGGKIAILS